MNKVIFLFLACVFVFGCDSTEPIENVDMVVQGVIRPEKNSGDSQEFLFVVKLLEISTHDVTFDYETSDGKAEAGTDYTAVSGSGTIPAGTRDFNIPVTVFGDDEWEQEETFTITISNAVNANIVTANAAGEISNDDKSGFVDSDGYITPDAQSGMTLIWADEFDGSAVDDNNWTFETGDHGWGNNELQDYKAGASNTQVANGKLTITAKNEPNIGYTSARMITKDKQEFKYGRIDIRAKMPQGQGIWPALWMLGHNISDVSWPSCGEIDIMELVGHEPNVTHGTIHWSNASGNHTYQGGEKTLPSGIFADEFHVFTIVWTNTKITWYLDEEEFHFQNVTSGEMSEFRNEFFFIFNIAVGGNWPGSPDATTVFPQTMEVDYIRIFQ